MHFQKINAIYEFYRYCTNQICLQKRRSQMTAPFINIYTEPKLFGINTPLLFSKTFVVIVSPSCIVFSSLEQFFCFSWILFHY